MKKLVLLFSLLTIFYVYSDTLAQSVKEIDYNNPSLDFFTTVLPDTMFLFELNKVDLSKLKYTFNNEMEQFETTLPFVVNAAIGSSEIFWFFKHIPKSSKDFSWMIYESNNTKVGICKSFLSIKTIGESYNVLQGEDQLTGAIRPGKYLLKMFVKEIPAIENLVYLRTGVSSRSYYRGLQSGFYLGRS
ncbi:hypothetical protein [Sphingobacterium sp. SGR-19]|uniref:hypothetical protein n=1 Tax=Sphingobacterium sp. SGR-19 TaxID=2710886 RepID=UPI0013EBCE5B|nr:hypothetical protein [Sphingobacterium sp. SGR-19]NGM66232.1 hypothetical protein [Sphingobacterium sp. SGR-19]